MLVVEGHRFEREDRFARPVHRPDPVLETRRGNDRAEVTVSIHHNRVADNGCPANAGNKRRRLDSLPADANRPGLTSYPSVADVDVSTTYGNIGACVISQCDVILTGCVAAERAITGGRITMTGGIAGERNITDSRVLGATYVPRSEEHTSELQSQ